MKVTFLRYLIHSTAFHEGILFYTESLRSKSNRLLPLGTVFPKNPRHLKGLSNFTYATVYPRHEIVWPQLDALTVYLRSLLGQRSYVQPLKFDRVRGH